MHNMYVHTFQLAQSVNLKMLEVYETKRLADNINFPLFLKYTKGQLILKCLFCVYNFFQKKKENTSNIVVKTNSFVLFLEEFTA